MTKPANNSNKPSPSDTPTDRPNDKGHKSVLKERDKKYDGDDANFGNVNKQYREDGEPVHPIKNPPTEQKGQEEGKVQP
ncbi:hypothetical protein [Mucilaginibacter ginkgonis]|uniref:Uncharacterized protein n=1 Tax=Mucilaginibacter ginkgonis TaxID=2682091 RepID=A0A6I4INZ6_9SPHI|nr:hypothetical protein [Mucilaginibacter ginkgonis]QQL48324.1 hypothetical protein GO620_008960 [Mucilaginibacter ginkgonis]